MQLPTMTHSPYVMLILDLDEPAPPESLFFLVKEFLYSSEQLMSVLTVSSWYLYHSCVGILSEWVRIVFQRTIM